jgi:hypothetical protein
VARSKAEIKALVAGARLPERVVSIPMRGDLAAECERLEEQLRDLELEQGGPGASLSGNPRAREVAEQIEALRAQMKDSMLEFRLRALPKRRGGKQPTWNQLKDANPPRENHPVDKENGCNTDEFGEQLLRLSIVEPELDDEDWNNLLDGLSDGTFLVLVGYCFGVNQSDVDVPFSFAASQILRNSDSE